MPDIELNKYSFLPEALSRVEELGLVLSDLLLKPLHSVLERANACVMAAVEGGELPPPSTDEDEEVLAFLVVLLLLKLINDRMLTRRLALMFSKRVGRFLSQEGVDKLLYILTKLGILSRQVEGAAHGYGIAISAFSYVENMPERVGAWKLVHRLVEGGWVYVNKGEAVRLGEEAVKKLIEKRVEEVKISEADLPEGMCLMLEKIRDKWNSRVRELKADWVQPSGEVEEEAFPPCIRGVLADLRSGKNILHSARFALASFLLNVGMDVERVLEVFSTTPDFNERIARYQIEHIAGRRGSGKRYTPYKCESMKTLGLCRAECEVKHPLHYYRRALHRKRTGGKGSEEGELALGTQLPTRPPLG